MATTYQGNKNGTAFIPTVSRPTDIRTVVDSVNDLTNKSIPYLYQGLVVNVKGTGDLYVLIGNALQSTNMEYWKKVGEDAEVDLTGYVKIEDLPEFLTDSDPTDPELQVEDHVLKFKK